MRTLLATFALATVLGLTAPESASAQVYVTPGYGDWSVGRYWNQSTYSAPGVYTLPSYAYVAPGPYYYGVGYGPPLYGSYPYSTYGFGYSGYPIYNHTGYRPWYNYQVYRYRSPYTGSDYGTFWGWDVD